MVSNYEIMRDKMRGEFVKYDQAKIVKKFSLRNDERYLYIEFLLRDYRIDRNTGFAEWSENSFSTSVEADYNESMTIYDVLCYAKDDCTLSGRYCPVHMLKGAGKSLEVGGSMFQNAADGFSGKLKALEAVCSVLGEKIDWKGDVAAKLYPFSFLPVILQYWDADEEFPANLKFMFDENILDYMHFETIFFMTGHIVKRIQEMMKTNFSTF